MTLVLDASVFFSGFPVTEKAYTTPSVVSELVDLRSKGRLEALLTEGLFVREPDPRFLEEVEAAARRTGDAEKLSRTDREVLALALEVQGVLVTDDFAVQNVAQPLGVPTRSIQQRTARQIRWRFRCSGCGRYYKNPGECPVCGAAIKRKLK
jgi:UPF0271 protein